MGPSVQQCLRSAPVSCSGVDPQGILSSKVEAVEGAVADGVTRGDVDALNGLVNDAATRLAADIEQVRFLLFISSGRRVHGAGDTGRLQGAGVCITS